MTDKPMRDLTRREMIEIAHLRYGQRAYFHMLGDQAHTLGVALRQSFALLMLNGEILEFRAPTMSRLADLLILELNSTVELVNRLQKRGLVLRVRDPIDLRLVHIHLTPEGQILAQEIARGQLQAVWEKLPPVLELGQRILAWPE